VGARGTEGEGRTAELLVGAELDEVGAEDDALDPVREVVHLRHRVVWQLVARRRGPLRPKYATYWPAPPPPAATSTEGKANLAHSATRPII